MPSVRGTIAVFLGSARYPDSEILSSEAIENSYKFNRTYFRDVLGIGESDTLDLFNSNELAVEQILKTDEFLREKRSALQNELLTICFSYNGHGFYRDGASSFFWSIQKTSDRNKWATSIDVKSFGQAFTELGKNTRVFGFIDCCFAGATEDIWLNAGIGTGLPSAHTQAANGAMGGPRGVSLICSSSRDRYSHVLQDHSMTVFGASLSEVLSVENPAPGTKLTSYELASLVLEHNQSNPDIAEQSPHVLTPRQTDGNLSTEPFYPYIFQTETDENSSLLRYAIAVEPSIDLLLGLSEKLESDLVKKIQGHGVFGNIYAIRSRVKSKDSVLRQVRERRQVSDKSYAFTDMDDLVGIRLLTLFQDQAFDVAQGIAKFIVEEGSGGALPNARVEDCRVYAAGATGASSIRYKSLSRSLANSFQELGFDKEASVYLKESLYSSIRIVVRCKLDDKPHMSIPVEFQIRSVFDDTWAEIDHRFRYNNATYSKKTDVGLVSTDSASQLKVLKTMLDSVSDLSNILYGEEAVSSLTLTNQVVGFENVETLNDLWPDTTQLKESQADLISRVGKLLERQYRLSSSQLERMQAGGPGIKIGQEAKLVEQYLILAEEFANVASEIVNNFRLEFPLEENEERADFGLYFFSREGEAFCRQATGVESEVILAEAIYEDLVEVFPYLPLPSFRYAQIKSKLGKYSEAIEWFELSLRLVQSYSGDDRRRLRFAYMTQGQVAHILTHGDRLVGYQYWCIAEKMLSQIVSLESVAEFEEVAKIYAEAIKVSYRNYEKIEDSHGKRAAANNILSYICSMAQLRPGKAASFPVDKPSREWVQERANELRSWAESDTGKEDLRYLDTLAHVCVLLGSSKLAKEYSARVVSLISQLRNWGEPGSSDFFHIERMLRDCRFIEVSEGKALPPPNIGGRGNRQ